MSWRASTSFLVWEDCNGNMALAGTVLGIRDKEGKKGPAGRLIWSAVHPLS